MLRKKQWTNFGSMLWNGMMELGNMPGMSTYFRICGISTYNQKTVEIILRSTKWDPKTGPPKVCVGDVFLYERLASQTKKTHQLQFFSILSFCDHRPWPRKKMIEFCRDRDSSGDSVLGSCCIWPHHSMTRHLRQKMRMQKSLTQNRHEVKLPRKQVMFWRRTILKSSG